MAASVAAGPRHPYHRSTCRRHSVARARPLPASRTRRQFSPRMLRITSRSKWVQRSASFSLPAVYFSNGYAQTPNFGASTAAPGNRHGGFDESNIQRKLGTPPQLLIMRTLIIFSMFAAVHSSTYPRCSSSLFCARPPPRASNAQMQLVHVLRDDDDGDANEDASILKVSQVVDEYGEAKEPTGRSVASMQFMITNAMRAQLTALGYAEEEIDAMDPPRAAEILAEAASGAVLSSKRPQKKARRPRQIHLP